MTGRWPQGPQPAAEGEKQTRAQALTRWLRRVASRRGSGQRGSPGPASSSSNSGDRAGASGPESTGGPEGVGGPATVRGATVIAGQQPEGQEPQLAGQVEGGQAAGAQRRGGQALGGPPLLGHPGTSPPGIGSPGPGQSSAHHPPPEASVSRVLRQAAAWSWCLLLTGVLVYLAFRLAVELRLVVLPFVAATLLTALLQPSVSWLKQRGMKPLPATWLLFLAALIVIAGAIYLFANRLSADFPSLYDQVQRTAREVQHSLSGPPFHLNATRLQNTTNAIERYLSQHKAAVAGTVLTGGKYALEFSAGVVLTLFITFFLLKDGPRIWTWVISGMKERTNRRVARAGDSAWQALVAYVRGTTLVAAIHALFIGVAMWLLGTPLLVPFIVLVFLAAFLPIVGILVVGALAILVTLATKGVVAAVILFIVFIVENQIESHLLQPLLIGRLVRLHPLAIILVLAVGGIIAGIPGAIVAVPFAAVVTYAWSALRAEDPED